MVIRRLEPKSLSSASAGADGYGVDVSEDVVENMRGRAAKCRRLAAAVTDDQTVQALLAMAAEIDADIARLRAQSERPAD